MSIIRRWKMGEEELPATRFTMIARTWRLLEGEEHLWTFLRLRGIEPTNNAAELGTSARRAGAEIERRDGKRVGQPVRRTRPERGGNVPPTGPQCAGVPHGLFPGSRYGWSTPLTAGVQSWERSALIRPL